MKVLTSTIGTQKYFFETVTELKDYFKNLGVNPGDLGTQSCYKGVASMVAREFTISHQMVSLCIREGWAMGGVKEIYPK